MNIHPILVHFPIALLTIYAFMEMIQYKKLKNTDYWFNLKATFVIIGTIFAYLSLSTGELGINLYNRSYLPLIYTHEFIATATTYIFTFIALIYLISLINRKKLELKSKILKLIPKKGWIKIINFSNYILNKNIIIISLAIIGLIAILITGSLGGAIVYGPNVDPVVNFIYHLFF